MRQSPTHNVDDFLNEFIRFTDNANDPVFHREAQEAKAKEKTAHKYSEDFIDDFLRLVEKTILLNKQMEQLSLRGMGLKPDRGNFFGRAFFKMLHE